MNSFPFRVAGEKRPNWVVNSLFGLTLEEKLEIHRTFIVSAPVRSHSGIRSGD